MTIYDKGLLRAMKAAYKDEGYDVALTDGYITIQTDYGSLFIRTEVPVPEDKPLLQHLSQMQWIAVELE